MPETLIDCIEEQCDDLTPAFSYLPAGEIREMVTVTRADMHDIHMKWAQRLAVCGVGGGDNVIVAIAPGIDYIAAVYAAMRVGAVVVPCYPPFGRKAQERLTSIVSDIEVHAVVVDVEMAEGVGELFAASTQRDLLPVIITRDSSYESSTAIDTPACRGDSIALIQYTSGSTSAPKGVKLTHSNLVSNCRVLDHNMGHDEERQGLSWLPPYHDMGLMGTIFLSTYAHWHLTIMSPFDFIQNPQRWLRSIGELGITTAVAPNFALDTTVDSLSDPSLADGQERFDLSSLREFYCGAEPISPRTLRRFETAFAVHGYSPSALIPCYGMAEATLFIAGKPRGSTYRIDDRPDGSQVVCVGETAINHEVLIVRDGKSLSPFEEGEIYVSGPSVGAGYHGDSHQSSETFRAQVAGYGITPYLRTGDLGYLDGDGQLYVSGRIKDILIIDGENLYPSDIESTAENVSSVLKSVVVGNKEGSGFLILCEVADSADRRSLGSAITAEIVSVHAKRPDQTLMASRGAIARTTSGKVRRSETRRRLLSGEIVGVTSSRPSIQEVAI